MPVTTAKSGSAQPSFPRVHGGAKVKENRRFEILLAAARKSVCGEAHFDTLAVGENPARFVKATKLDDVIAKC